MTLVLSCLSPDFAIQVSDRRLTVGWPPRKAGEVTSEHANKAVLVNMRCAFGFTGFAKIGSERTDLWFAKQIRNRSKIPIQGAFHEVANALTAEFSKLPVEIRDISRHAFIGVGWGTHNSKPELRPVILQISNFLAHGKDQPARVPGAFEFAFEFLQRDQSILLRTAGAYVEEKIVVKLKRGLQRCVKEGTGPAAMSRLLASAVREVARYDETVGQQLMICSLPKRPVENGFGLAFAGALDNETIGFEYLGPESNEGVQFGPLFVAGDDIIDNFCARQTDGVQSVSGDWI